MDPDSLSRILAAGLCAAALALCWRLGALSAADDEKERRTRLGFSDGMAGLAAAFGLCAAGSCGAGLWALAPLGLLWLWLLLLAVGAAASVLVFALGCAHSGQHAAGAFSRALGAVLSAPAKLAFRALGLSCDSSVTPEELLSLADDAEEHSLIDENQKEMIANIVEFDDVMAVDIMTHRTELVSVEENTPVREVVRLAQEKGVSRIPVYRRTLDDIVGILHVKDLFAIWDTPEKNDVPARSYMRKAMFVPEACRARELLVEFKLKHTQVAVVVDEYGGTSGLVTMEDILEEIVGNIQDEFDNEEEELSPDGHGSFIAAGSADLEDVFDAFGLPMPEETADEPADFDTVGGLVADRLGRIPRADENARVEYGGLVFTVLQAAERRILKVLCERPGAAQDDAKKE